MPEGTFFSERYDEELKYKTIYWKDQGEEQPEQYDPNDDDLHKAGRLLIEVEAKDGRKTYNYVNGPIDDFDIVPEILEDFWGDDGDTGFTE